MLECIDNVLHTGLRLRFAQQFREGAFERVTLQLLDEDARRLQQQRGLLRQQRWCPGHRAEKHQEDDQQQDKVQNFAKTIGAAPERGKEAKHDISISHWL